MQQELGRPETGQVVPTVRDARPAALAPWRLPPLRAEQPSRNPN